MIKNDLKNLTVLFVDDESIQRVLMERMLSRIFNRVELAESGIEALEKCKENSYDLIITDFTMPKMDGCQLIEKIFDTNREQKIVILTANDPNELIEDRSCDITILRKPFKRDEGVRALIELLS